MKRSFGVFMLVLSSTVLAADIDADGMDDSWEAANGLNPGNPADASLDRDSDTLSNLLEFTNQSNPNKRDTDGDWLIDGLEVLTYFTKPNKADTDGDGVGDFAELINGFNPNDPDDLRSDTDQDGFATYQELQLGSDPRVALSVPDYLPQNYFESFENGVMPDLWYTPATGSVAAWGVDCRSAKADGVCALKAATNQRSNVHFMARFKSGKLKLSWASWTPDNLLITLDGAEVLSYTGAATWNTLTLPVADGVHELSISQDGNPMQYGLFMIDAVQFTGERPDNVSCIAPPIPEPTVTVVRYPFRDTIGHFNKATKIAQAPGDASRWFVAEQTGLIKVFDVANPNYADIRTYLDLSADLDTEGEAGLLSFAFDPDFPAVPEMYVVYVSAANLTTLSRFRLDDTDTPVNPTEQVILRLNKDSSYHYGGAIAFGPDPDGDGPQKPLLYMSIGDDTDGALAQNTTNLFGSMIRIDVLGVSYPLPGYRIPEGNAFAATNPKCGPTKTNGADCPEIIAWGFRNPWRFSIDMPTGDIWEGDVGNNTWEEVNRIAVGGNYGWPCYEGPSPTDEINLCDAGVAPIAPVAAYTHEEGRAIVGGVVYRGSAMPDQVGHYIFADLGPGSIFELVPNSNGGYEHVEIAQTPAITTDLTAGADGEIYFINYFQPDYQTWVPPPIGKLVRPWGGGDGDTAIADNLADTGCVDPADPTQPAAGVIPYDINALFWSDNAVKSRFMALPNHTTINIDAEHDWDFPVGSVLMKNFRLGGKLIETRLLMNRLDPDAGVGRWQGFSYEWDDSETHATRVVGGKTKRIGDQLWTYPSESQCIQCHRDAAGGALGPETAQLNKTYIYPGYTHAVNQLELLNDIGLFTSPLTEPVNKLPRLANPYDSSGSVSLYERARAYLHTNCSQCHRPGSGVSSDQDYRYSISLENTHACDVPPAHGSLDIDPEVARLIAPGKPENSVVLNRMSRRDANGMPPIGSHIYDAEGAALLGDWIASMQSCVTPSP